jgi:hypothetical protein
MELSRWGESDPELLQAALLHDTVEDTPTTVEELRAGFGPEVADLVDWLTAPDDPGEIRRYYDTGAAYDPRIVVLQFCDNDPSDNLANRVTVVENGNLKKLLMSRRPGPDSADTNGHGRAAFLTDGKPTMSNLFFNSTETLSPADLKKKFLDACRAEKLNYGMVVREMDNPAISLLHQDDFSELLASFGGNAATDRLPLVVYKIYLEDGREELVRGARITGLGTRSLRNLAGIGNDSFVFNYMQTQVTGFTGTALGAFGSAQGGLPASVVAPSLLFDELEVRGARGEAKRLPLLPAPPMSGK